MKKLVLLTGLTVLTTTLTSCSKPPKFGGFHQGSDDATADPGSDTGSDTETTTIVATDKFKDVQCTDQPVTGLRTWRRLSNVEFKNTVQSVFGVDGIDYSGLVSDISRQDVYDTMMVPSNYVDESRLTAYRRVAKAVAAKVDLTKIFPCLSAGASCMTTQLPTLAALAWRRPLDASEVTSLATVYTSTLADAGSDKAARYVVEAMILAEPFLYRSELGTKGSDGSYTLSDYEIASAISYTVLRMPPDATLRSLAAAKGLGTKEAVSKQVARLLADPAAKAAWKDFASMWLDTKNVQNAERTDMTILPQALRDAAEKEAGNLFSDTITKASGSTYQSFLEADSITTTDAVKSVYDVSPTNGVIKFKESDRRGPLGLASYLIATSADDHTSPVKRGSFVIDRLMCSNFAPAVKGTLPARMGAQTNRDVYLSLEVGGCAACHKPMNQIGFIFENFDMNGKHRTMADNQPITIDSSPVLDGKTVKVASAADFMTALANSNQGKECFARQLFRYSFGRRELSPEAMIGAKADTTIKVSPQVEVDNCQIRAAIDSMDAANGDMKAVLSSYLSSDLFRKRIDRAPVQ